MVPLSSINAGPTGVARSGTCHHRRRLFPCSGPARPYENYRTGSSQASSWSPCAPNAPERFFSAGARSAVTRKSTISTPASRNPASAPNTRRIVLQNARTVFANSFLVEFEGAIEIDIDLIQLRLVAQIQSHSGTRCLTDQSARPKMRRRRGRSTQKKFYRWPPVSNGSPNTCAYS